MIEELEEESIDRDGFDRKIKFIPEYSLQMLAKYSYFINYYCNKIKIMKILYAR